MELEVERVLKEKKIPYQLLRSSHKIVSYEDAKKEPGAEDECKTVIVRGKSGKYYAFFLRGMMRVDFSKAASAVGEKVSMISAEELKKATGKEPGEVCPFLLGDIPFFVDERVFSRASLQFGSGNAFIGLVISSKDLEKVARFSKRDFAKE